MSTNYPDLTYTQFPNEIDTFDYMVDIDLTTLPLALEYKSKFNSGDIVGANVLLEANPNLKKCFFNAEKYNRVIDGVKSSQRLFLEDVEQYLVNIVQPKGDYSSVIKYAKYNVVTYLYNSAIQAYMCIRTDTPIGTLPTNTTYWVPLTLRGERGATGVGLAPYGAWNGSTTYPVNALVAYNNALWGSLVSNTGIAPSKTATATWFLVMEFNSELLNFIDAATSKTYKQVVNNKKVYLEDLSNGNRIDIALITDIPSSLPANGGDAATVNGKTVLSNVPLNAKFTDTVFEHPTNPGNKHLPSGGSVGQILKNSADGTGSWGNFTTVVTGTLTVANWTGSSAPYSQNITVNGVTASNNIIFDVGMGVTTEQLNSAIDAKLKATAQATNSITIKAFGDKPTVNIPVQFMIIG